MADGEKRIDMATTRAELIHILIEYAGDDYRDEQAALVESFVDDAIEEVRHARFPNGHANEKTLIAQTEDVLARYPSNIRSIMEYHYDKIGKKGVKTFYEAGQTTTWESGGTPDSFFKGIIPVATLSK